MTATSPPTSPPTSPSGAPATTSPIPICDPAAPAAPTMRAGGRNATSIDASRPFSGPLTRRPAAGRPGLRASTRGSRAIRPGRGLRPPSTPLSRQESADQSLPAWLVSNRYPTSNPPPHFAGASTRPRWSPAPGYSRRRARNKARRAQPGNPRPSIPHPRPSTTPERSEIDRTPDPTGADDAATWCWTGWGFRKSAWLSTRSKCQAGPPC